jgi:hypothetical protein
VVTNIEAKALLVTSVKPRGGQDCEHILGALVDTALSLQPGKRLDILSADINCNPCLKEEGK